VLQNFQRGIQPIVTEPVHSESGAVLFVEQNPRAPGREFQHGRSAQSPVGDEHGSALCERLHFQRHIFHRHARQPVDPFVFDVERK